jgi:hypothetical protein
MSTDQINVCVSGLFDRNGTRCVIYLAVPNETYVCVSEVSLFCDRECGGENRKCDAVV